jgi:hypothetical protein
MLSRQTEATQMSGGKHDDGEWLWNEYPVDRWK